MCWSGCTDVWTNMLLYCFYQERNLRCVSFHCDRQKIIKKLIRLHRCSDWSEPLLSCIVLFTRSAIWDVYRFHIDRQSIVKKLTRLRCCADQSESLLSCMQKTLQERNDLYSMIPKSDNQTTFSIREVHQSHCATRWIMCWPDCTGVQTDLPLYCFENKPVVFSSRRENYLSIWSL